MIDYHNVHRSHLALQLQSQLLADGIENRGPGSILDRRAGRRRGAVKALLRSESQIEIVSAFEAGLIDHRMRDVRTRPLMDFLGKA